MGGGLTLPPLGELGPRLTQCGQGRGLPACQVSSWCVQAFGHSARTSQTDRQADRSGRRSDSVGRTVLQTVAPKSEILHFVHVKHASSVTFYHLSNRYLSNIMKISAKTKTMQNNNILLFVYEHCWRCERTPNCGMVRVLTGHYRHCNWLVEKASPDTGPYKWWTFWAPFVEKKLLQTISIFHVLLVKVASVHRVRFLLCWCSTVDRPILLNYKPLSLLKVICNGFFTKLMKK